MSAGSKAGAFSGQRWCDLMLTEVGDRRGLTLNGGSGLRKWCRCRRSRELRRRGPEPISDREITLLYSIRAVLTTFNFANYKGYSKGRYDCKWKVVGCDALVLCGSWSCTSRNMVRAREGCCELAETGLHFLNVAHTGPFAKNETSSSPDKKFETRRQWGKLLLTRLTIIFSPTIVLCRFSSFPLTKPTDQAFVFAARLRAASTICTASPSGRKTEKERGRKKKKHIALCRANQQSKFPKTPGHPSRVSPRPFHCLAGPLFLSRSATGNVEPFLKELLRRVESRIPKIAPLV